MTSIFLSGGSGFFGGILKRILLDRGFSVVSFDLIADTDRHPNLVSVQGDLRDTAQVNKVFAEYKMDGVAHIAAMLAHGSHVDETGLWASNVDGTRHLAEACQAHRIRSFVFTSTNCLWARNFHRPVTEEDTPEPIEVYGRSKAEAERVLADFPDINPVIIRCPTIIEEGRLGLLSILFEFIQEGRKVWVVGDGSNRYQFIYAPDLADACIRALSFGKPALFNIGSDNVATMREVYENVIRNVGTKSRVASLPKAPTLAAMRAAHVLKISPLGPYHYKMIAEDFLFDTTRIKRDLGWQPTLTNQGMMTRAYEYYARNKQEIAARTNVSAHSKSADMGVIRLLKWLS
jgi:nucleoside-diphosphate-sugar epimerase